jgi:hypothetical protein
MIGIALILSVLALVIAIIKKGRYLKLVLGLTIFCILTFLITYKLANPICSPNTTCNPFAGLGPAIIGSAIMLLAALTALVLSFQKKN